MYLHYAPMYIIIISCFYKNTKNNMRVNIETPAKILFIGSCWAMQSGGVPGALAAAYQCANLTNSFSCLPNDKLT